MFGRWFWRIVAPLLLLDIFFRRLPYARYRAPPHDRTIHVAEIETTNTLRPGDVLLCRGDSADSASVAAWSCSEFTHVAVVGPDKHVYDITPVENERRMGLREYVESYEGMVFWRPVRKPLDASDWKPVPANLLFRENGTALLGATFAENALAADLWDKVFAARYAPGKAFCSEYVCMALGLPVPAVSHPRNFSKNGRYAHLYAPETYRLIV
jgi:hypothetical protein